VPAGEPARRRRDLGQHDLIDAGAVDRLVAASGVGEGDLVVDVGAGRGPVTDALLARRARVVAVELDRARAARLEERYAAEPRVRVVAGDALRVPLPRRPYAVVANPPFAITTALLRRLLDDPRVPVRRVDVVVQRQAARRFASASDPTALRWSPWWDLTEGPRVYRRAFRPQPPCDAAVLRARRRDAPLLPAELAPVFARFVAHHHARWGAPDRGARWWVRRFRSRSRF
jgi:23S rRNA (adenine-N6)-dimethyltransferase